MTALLAIGPYIFQLEPLNMQSLEQEVPHRFASMGNLATHPSQHDIGADQESLSIKGKLFPHVMSGARDEVEALKRSVRLGSSFMVVTGSGRVLGRYVIESATESASVLDPSGEPRVLDYSLKLRSVARAGRGGFGFSLFT